ncbi:unnamed protein product [Adineta ricciae]|uniref:Uncharacterized protein n=1 Tax=Adineta ricciae TaxID=249248 RepID=A0A815DZM0_ADIRI|nr:unnamed protein product [Adineta ricciae]
MHSLSCYFLLHHHFEALTISSDYISAYSGSVNNDIMSDEREGTDSIDSAEPQTENLSSDSTINPTDEENQFIYDEDSERLTCVGSTFDDIPQSIIDAYASRAKILDLSKNHFRSLGCVKNFPNLEELILDDNQLDDVHTRFPKLPNLQTLTLNKNRFQDIYKLVDQLRQAYPTLIYLSLLGNEACPYRISSVSSNGADLNSFAQDRLEEEYQRYRHLLIFRIPTLKFLDARDINANERRIATQLGDILYSIAETKQSQSNADDDDQKSSKRGLYSPLPSAANQSQARTSFGKVRHTYNGEGSQGNKFLRDGDL